MVRRVWRGPAGRARVDTRGSTCTCLRVCTCGQHPASPILGGPESRRPVAPRRRRILIIYCTLRRSPRGWLIGLPRSSGDPTECTGPAHATTSPVRQRAGVGWLAEVREGNMRTKRRGADSLVAQLSVGRVFGPRSTKKKVAQKEEALAAPPPADTADQATVGADSPPRACSTARPRAPMASFLVSCARRRWHRGCCPPTCLPCVPTAH